MMMKNLRQPRKPLKVQQLHGPTHRPPQVRLKKNSYTSIYSKSPNTLQKSNLQTPSPHCTNSPTPKPPAANEMQRKHIRIYLQRDNDGKNGKKLERHS